MAAGLTSAPGKLQGLGPLAGSAFASELLNVALLPYIARQYETSAIAVFALASSVGSIVAIASSLRLEYAIPFCESKDRDVISSLTLFGSVAVGLLLLLFGGAFPSQKWLALAALIGISASFASIASFILIARAEPRRLASSRVVGGLIRAALILLLPAMGAQSALALVSATSGGMLAAASFGLMRIDSWKFQRADIGRLLQKYRAFPLVQLPTALVNATSMEMGLISLSAVGANLDDVASVGLAQRAVMRPGGIVVNATAEAFLGDVSRSRGDQDASRSHRSVLRRLSLFGIVIGMVGGLGSVFVLPFVFGENYPNVGLYALPMCLVIGVRLVANPSQQLLVAHQWHRANFVLSGTRLTAVVCLPVVAFQTWHDPLIAFWFYCAGSFLTYGALVLYVRRRLSRS